MATDREPRFMLERRRIMDGRRSFSAELEEAREVNDSLLSRVQQLRRLDAAHELRSYEDAALRWSPQSRRAPRRLGDETALERRLERLQKLVARLAVDRNVLERTQIAERSRESRRVTAAVAFGKWARLTRSCSPLRRELAERHAEQQRLGAELAVATTSGEELRRRLSSAAETQSALEREMAAALERSRDAERAAATDDARLAQATTRVADLERRLQHERSLRLEAESAATQARADADELERRVRRETTLRLQAESTSAERDADLAGCRAQLRDALGRDVELEAQRVALSVRDLVEELATQRDRARLDHVRIARRREARVIARRSCLVVQSRLLARAFQRWKLRGVVLLARTQLVSALTHALECKVRASLLNPADSAADLECAHAVIHAALRPFDLARRPPPDYDDEIKLGQIAAVDRGSDLDAGPNAAGVPDYPLPADDGALRH